jgi:hypothetical protein
MCSGDDHNCPQFELHRQKLLEELDSERRSFLKSAFAASGGAAAAWAAGGAVVSEPARAFFLCKMSWNVPVSSHSMAVPHSSESPWEACVS